MSYAPPVPPGLTADDIRAIVHALLATRQSARDVEFVEIHQHTWLDDNASRYVDAVRCATCGQRIPRIDIPQHEAVGWRIIGVPLEQDPAVRAGTFRLKIESQGYGPRCPLPSSSAPADSYTGQQEHLGRAVDDLTDVIRVTIRGDARRLQRALARAVARARRIAR